MSTITLIGMLIPSPNHQILAQSLAPVLYLPAILPAPETFRIVETVTYGTHYGGLQPINGNFVSQLAQPIYNAKIQFTAYDIRGLLLNRETEITFLPVTYPGQINGFRILSHVGYRTELELVDWTLTSTKTYLSPSLIFTPTNQNSPDLPNGNTLYSSMEGIVINDTGVTLTNISLAVWSIKNTDGYGSPPVQPIPILLPNETVPFSASFNPINYGVALNTIHVAAQGIASP